MIPLWLIGSIAGVVVAGGIWLHGRGVGADGVLAQWNEQVRVDKEAADAAREVDRLRARTVDAEYQANRAAAARRMASPSPESEYALKASICPPPGVFGKPLELGDVPVPGSWLERLRNAGADY
jgi:hypothetical protein